jgi:hypothetical protein
VEQAEKAVEGKENYSEDIPFMRENLVRYHERKNEWYAAKALKRKGGVVKAAESAAKPETKKEEGDEEPTTGAVDEAGDAEEEEPEEAKNPVDVEGVVIVLKDVPDDIDFGKIKTFFKQHGEVQYVEIDKGTKMSHIRLAGGANAATKVLDLAKKGVVEVKSEEGKENSTEDKSVTVEIDGKELIADVLSGDEEVTYWKKLHEHWSASKNQRGNQRGGGRGRGRGKGFRRGGRGGGGWRGGRKRGAESSGGDRRSSPRAAKQARTD